MVGVGKNFYSSTAKGYAMGINPGDVNDGFVKIVVDKDTNHILGMHVVGPQASILFQPYVNLMNSGITPLTTINEEIASERTKRLREKGISRDMDPRSVITVGETMSPHHPLWRSSCGHKHITKIVGKQNTKKTDTRLYRFFFISLKEQCVLSFIFIHYNIMAPY